jgi:hypothetical protein
MSDDNWRATIARRELELRQFHDSFRWRSFAVAQLVDEWIATGKLRRQPEYPAPHRRRDESGEYEHPATGEPMLDGLPHPGL